MALPLIEFAQVVHIGTLDPTDKGKHGTSLEGHGLSVSQSPESWSRIARLGGYSWWRLEKAGGCFVDAHHLSKAQRKAITDWGVEQGLVERVALWRAVWEDDELGGEEVWFSFESKEEAEFEAEERGEVRRASGLKGTDKLDALIGQQSGLECFDLLLVAYAELETDLDGIHWSDIDDGHLSAPRSVILPAKVAEWQAEKVYEPRPGLSGLEDPAMAAIVESLHGDGYERDL